MQFKMGQAELLALNALSALLFLGKFALPGCTQTLAFRLLQQCLPLKWSTGKRCWPLSTPGGEQIRNAPKTEKRTSQTFSYAASWRCHRSQAAQLTNRQHLPCSEEWLASHYGIGMEFPGARGPPHADVPSSQRRKATRDTAPSHH